jgi:ATP-binding cassette subfamily F protein uup
LEGDGIIHEYPGGYDDWLIQRQSISNLKPPKIKVKKYIVKKVKPIVPRKLNHKEQQELDKLPLKIEELETEQKTLYSLFADLTFYQRDPAEINQTKARSVSLSEELQKAYERWDYLAELAE